MTTKPYLNMEYQPGLVSVIVPVYNREHLIEETFDSILAQTYRPIEIVAINDGSTDTSLQILKTYSERYPGLFTVIDQHNTGQVIARNNGIRAAKGEYFAFLDSDDKWLPEKLEKQIPLFKKTNVALVYSGIEKIDDQGKPYNIELCDPTRTHNLYLHLLVRNQMTGGTVVITRAALKKAGLFDESFKAAENWDLWLRICRDHHAALVNEPLLQYRMHAQNMSKDSLLMVQAKKTIIKKHCTQPSRNDQEAHYHNLAYADADYCLGVHYFTNGMYHDAKPYFIKAFKRKLFYKDSLTRLIRCYLGRGNHYLSSLKRKMTSK